MRKAVEKMKFFLQTGFGNSKHFAGGGVSAKVQGLMQGNGVSPVGWAVISVVILRAHGKKGHGGTILCPITNLSATLSAIFYINNTDLLHINLYGNGTAGDAHLAIQHSVKSWGDLLIATGDTLKPEKCFISIILSEWVRYKDNSLSGDFKVSVPLLEGGSAAIAYYPANHAEKNWEQ
jgi:hypothetical protein